MRLFGYLGGQAGLKIRNGKGGNNEGVKWDPVWQGVGEG